MLVLIDIIQKLLYTIRTCSKIKANSWGAIKIMKIEEFINILKKLQTIGVDVSKLVTIDTVETLAKRSEISKEKLEEMGLDSTLKIGNQKTRIAQAYRGKGTNKPPTQEQIEKLVKLGLV